MIRLTHGFHSIALGSEAWVNPPKAKKEKIFFELGHHSLVYSFYYFSCNNVKNEVQAGLTTQGIARPVISGKALANSGFTSLSV